MTSVSSNEARNSLGKLMRMASEDKEGIVINVRGEPRAALISYAEYEEFMNLKRRKKAREALEKLREIRRRVQERTGDLSEEERYRLAGFGEKTIEETVQHDREIAHNHKPTTSG